MYQFPIDIGTARFEDDVLAVLARLQRRPLPEAPIAFYGSSSFRYWHSMAMDLARLDVVNLGFGGGTCTSALHYMDTLLVPLQPVKVVLYFGENDISLDGLSAASALAGLRLLCERIQKRLPAVPIYVLSAKQSLNKWLYADVVTQFNAMAEAYCREARGIEFVDVTHVLLGQHGRPMGRYFLEDMIHLNAAGYAQWAQILHQHEGLL